MPRIEGVKPASADGILSVEGAVDEVLHGAQKALVELNLVGSCQGQQRPTGSPPEVGIIDGKIVLAEANETTKLNAILDSDPGARYVGEWAIGTNNRVRHAMLDTLFDEKIGGSFHLTPGQAYDDADNGNRSRIHWDLVLIQRPDYGGGEIWFDDELIRKDGSFLPADLQGLNEGL